MPQCRPLLPALLAAAASASGTPASAGQATNTLPATVNVASGCALTTRPLTFVAPSATAAVLLDATSDLTVTCTPDTEYAIAIDRGQNSTLLNRRMVSTSTGTHVVYDVFRDPLRLLMWGNTALTDVNGNSGTGAPQSITIYGRVPAAALIAAGDYRDLLTVALNF